MSEPQLYFRKTDEFPPPDGCWNRAPDGTIVVKCPKCPSHVGLTSPPFMVEFTGKILPEFGCPKCNTIVPAMLEGLTSDEGACVTCNHKHGEQQCQCGCLIGTGWRPLSSLKVHVEQLPIAVNLNEEHGHVMLIVGNTAVPLNPPVAVQIAQALMGAAMQLEQKQKKLIVTSQMPGDGQSPFPPGMPGVPPMFKRRG